MKLSDWRFILPENNDFLSRPFITREGVKEHVLGITILKSAGRDHLHPRVLEWLGEISGPLRLIFNKSRTTRDLPEDWKSEKVVSRVKNDKWCDPGNDVGNHGHLGLHLLGFCGDQF